MPSMVSVYHIAEYSMKSRNLRTIVPQSTLDDVCAGKDDKESNNKPIFPSAPPRPVFSADKPVFLVSQQSSCLPDLVRQILPRQVDANEREVQHMMHESYRTTMLMSYGTVEWRMATSSTPGGSIPTFITEGSMPGQISADVPHFLKWFHTICNQGTA
ncbi:uncharacterized protein F5891DRAFT_1213678 [Suillus fuscotomentosus]|uniref:DUF3074 domain-containing protein n=1 Tax=Suillus fuscotomentosus TaxID=1912939 RepID=A0AAD4DQX1_9AGAM|nr:uncharacterized protein F5891DRAFT_1213678 [Suillus fuscotomentosus]KAG1890517.1 hypothetical protein F5891DRAFT_1213678 [Suillus fuscotomentosus]